MTDNKTRQEGPPAADLIQEPDAIRAADQAKKDALKFVKDNEEAITIVRNALIKKLGQETGRDFSEVIFSISPQTIIDVQANIDLVFKELATPKNEHVLRGWNMAKARIAELLFSQAFIAHIINRVQGIQETQENFYTEFKRVYPYLCRKMEEKRNREYELREFSIYARITIQEITTLWKTGKATGQESKLILDAIREADKAKQQGGIVDSLGLKDAGYLPLYQGNLTNELMRLTARDFELAAEGNKAFYTGPNGHKYTLDKIDQMQGNLTTSAKKILDTAALYLTQGNYYRGGKTNINPTVEIPLKDYGEKNGQELTPREMETKEEQEKENKRVKERLKELKKTIRRDLSDLAKISWTAEETKGKNKGDYTELHIISSHSIKQGIIRINFDIDAARYLVNAYTMPFPTILLKHDNKKPNSYIIGRKIAQQNGMDNNYFSGTDCTLSVKTLLSAGAEIPTMEELKARNQRNWKDKIKRPLEVALNDNVTIGLIKKWEYRHPKTGEIYTADQAQGLKWPTYSTLMVDWTMAETPPEQTARRLRIEQAKAQAGTAAKKKRGRPPKAAASANN